MAVSKEYRAYMITAAVVIFLSLIFTVLNILVFPDFLVHPVLNDVAFVAFAFSVISFFKAITVKSPVFFMLGAVLFGLVVLYVLLALIIYLWWLAIVVTVSLWLIAAFITYAVCGNRTEAIALNKSSEYKDYKERMKEKYAQAEEEKKKDLPEIKSFKD